MSIALMTLAWKSSFHSGKKMVLLALCDNANDQGECYPSISMLAEKCSMSERSVFSHLSDLEKDGVISRENRIGRSTIYHIAPCKICTPAKSAPLQNLHPPPATVAPTPLQNLHPPPATVAPITISEPSSEPSMIKTKPRKTADDFDAAGYLVSLGVDLGVAADWLKLRRSKKADATKTAIDVIVAEAAKAGWTIDAALREGCSRGWTGFKAKWIDQDVSANWQDKKQANEDATNRAIRDFGAGVQAKPALIGSSA